MESSATQSGFSQRTAWARTLETPLRHFLRTETGSAAVLLAATVAALAWVNIDQHSYASVWSTTLSIQLGDHGVSLDLVDWINSGLMTFFFFVVGLEARREFDVGELRERRRVALPLLAGIGGMAVAVLLYLAINAGDSSAHGWGVAMSTDTAFALGMLALVGPRFSDRLRAFMLTVVVVDDLLALVVIATVYASSVVTWALLVAIGFFCLVLLANRLPARLGLLSFALGAAAWVSLLKSGIDPVVIGLAMGLVTYAAPAARSDLERATDLFKLFREQPTSELAREARLGLESAVSPNERLQQLWHPWTSYAIVPLFALANAGIAIDGDFLSSAYRSPVTLGIIAGYVLGKPLGVVGVSWLTTKLSRGRLRPPVGWAAVAGAGAVSGIGFTVSLLIATIALHGEQLRAGEARRADRGGAGGAARVGRLPGHEHAARARPRAGDARDRRDDRRPRRRRRPRPRPHPRPLEAPVTIVEYGDFECPYCGQAEPIVRELLAHHGDVRYVWRHLPLHDVHPRAQLAAEASEAAAEQGAFWEMHDLLLERQDALTPVDLIAYAGELGLDVERFRNDLRAHAGADHVANDIDGADLSDVSGTPTFFINGHRHQGAYDIDTLSAAVKAAGARATLVG